MDIKKIGDVISTIIIFGMIILVLGAAALINE